MAVEPLNPGDMPGYVLADFNLAQRVIARLSDPDNRLQFDFWHATRIAGSTARLWDRFAPLVDHVLVAGLTARQEPDETALRLLAKEAEFCSDWGLAEYRPASRTSTGLGRLAEARLGAKAGPDRHKDGAKGC